MVATTLGSEEVKLVGFTGTEGISRPYRYELKLRIGLDDFDPATLVGTAVRFAILPEEDGSEGARFFSGYIASVSHDGRTQRYHRLTAEVVPWTWFLTRRVDYQIFQAKTVPQIAQAVLQKIGLGKVDVSLLRDRYPQRRNCVQYRESDFDFVSRLLEEEGIAYWFREDDSGGPASLVLADRAEAYWSCADRELHRRSATGTGQAGDDILDWKHAWEQRTVRWVQRDFDFKRPNLTLEAQRDADLAVPTGTELEIFEYPGGYERRDEGDRLTRARAQAEECACEVVRGSSRYSFLSAGGKFTIGRHAVEAENGRSWAVVEVEHEVLGGAEIEVERALETPTPYINRFRCIPVERTFRPERRTPKPRIQGVQTALVVGPKGEEIHVDRYGRVKVQFHWDRHGRRNEQSSCWIRVSQPWAGAGYGGLAIPRIGQEVIVEFEEGDPDRPLINGRLYNGANAVPASHAGRDPGKTPAPKDVREAAMMTSIRSQSLGGSGGHNEITMNDTAGAEGLFIKAQKDEIHLVGNDRSDTVAHDEIREVGNDRTRRVGNNEMIEVGVNQSIKVGQNVVIDAGTSITLKCGASSIHMNQAGFITISGSVINIVGSATATMVAPITNVVGGVMVTTTGTINLSSGMIHKVTAGRLATVSAAQTEIEGSTTTMVNGGQVLINC